MSSKSSKVNEKLNKNKLSDENNNNLSKSLKPLEISEILKLSEEDKWKYLAEQKWDFYKQLKKLSDEQASALYKDLTIRWENSEKRVKEVEKACMDLKFEDDSLEEGRQEILGELIDKACQAFDIYDEHMNRKIPMGHRLVLEATLLEMINVSFDIVQKICDRFDELRGDRDGVTNERDWLRVEIRLRDMLLSEIHEKFLLSYLEQPW